MTSQTKARGKGGEPKAGRERRQPNFSSPVNPLRIASCSWVSMAIGVLASWCAWVES